MGGAVGYREFKLVRLGGVGDTEHIERQDTQSKGETDMTITAEAQSIATKLQQAREYLEMYDADEQPELVAELKAYIAEQKEKLENLGVFAA